MINLYIKWKIFLWKKEGWWAKNSGLINDGNQYFHKDFRWVWSKNSPCLKSYDISQNNPCKTWYADNRTWGSPRNSAEIRCGKKIWSRCMCPACINVNDYKLLLPSHAAPLPTVIVLPPLGHCFHKLILTENLNKASYTVVEKYVSSFFLRG